MAWDPVTDAPLWESIDADRARCIVHDITWTRGQTFVLSATVIAHGMCPECARRPKRDPAIVVPDYWIPNGPGLLCQWHHDWFAPDEGCRVCIDEDASTPTYSGSNDADLAPTRLTADNERKTRSPRS